MRAINILQQQKLIGVLVKFRKLSFLLCFCLLGCSDYNSPQKEDVIVLSQYLNSQSASVSSDPYFSSIYQPGDKWYEIMGYIQHGRHDLAVNKLKPLVAAGDIDAMFWYAKMIFRSSVKSIEPAYQLYVKAAKLGQPYAALALDPSTNECTTYFGTLCKTSWGALATKLFKVKAKQGDLRAQYYLAQQQPLNNQAQRDIYLKKLIAFSEQGYFQPLYNYAQDIYYMPHPSYALRTLAISIYKLGAKHNFIPAITYLINNKDKIKSEKIDDIPYIKQGVSLGSGLAFTMKYFYIHEGKMQGDVVLTVLMLDELSGDSMVNMLYFGSKFINMTEAEKKLKIEKLKKREIAARKIVKQELAKIPKMIFLDGFTDRSDWVD